MYVHVRVHVCTHVVTADANGPEKKFGKLLPKIFYWDKKIFLNKVFARFERLKIPANLLICTLSFFSHGIFSATSRSNISPFF